MKYLLSLLFLVSFSCSAQQYNASIAAHRQKYADDFLTDEHSPLKKGDVKYLRFYDADSTYRIEANADLLQNAQPFNMPTFSGGAHQYIRYAVLSFTLHGKPYKLTVYRNVALAATAQYANYLFLPFNDDTNGTETYGGGRYIDLSTGDFKDGKVIIDFNKNYNPYCAFSAEYSCPKPPDENNLPIAIKAGEKLFAKEVTH